MSYAPLVFKFVERHGPSPITLPCGGCLLFEGGKERHMGLEITEGMRVLLVGFLEREKEKKKNVKKKGGEHCIWGI